MLNFSGISNRSILGKFFRAPLSLLPKEMPVPILQGPLFGKKWILGSSNHGCWLGSYEFNKQRVIIDIIKEGNTVYDIGANVGFYTLLSSVLVGKEGWVVAFEPLPRNLVYLNRHVKMNKCLNVDVLPYAVYDCETTAKFKCSNNPSEGYLSKKGDIAVKTVVIDKLIESKKISPPDVMKIDVEGAEFNVLRGSYQLIEGKKPIIFLATHGISIHKNCIEYLRRFDYNLKPLNGPSVESCDEIVAEPF